MPEVGQLAIHLALVLSAYSAVMSLAGGLRRKAEFVASAEHAAFAVWGAALVAVAALLHGLVSHAFRIEYVAGYSSTTLPINYAITALWGGQKGSLLF